MQGKISNDVVNDNILKLIISYVDSSIVDRNKKLEIVNAGISILPEGNQKDLLILVLNAYSSTNNWPTVSSLVFKGYTLGVFTDIVPQITAADISIFYETYLEKEVIREAGGKLIEIAKETGTLTRDSMCQKVGDIFHSLSAENKQDIKETTSYQDYMASKNQPAGALTFIKQIDEKVLGVTKGTMMTVAGFAGQFKTTTAISILYSNAIKCKQNGLFISMEMPKKVLKPYIIARHSYHEKFSGMFNPIFKGKIIHKMLSQGEEAAMKVVEDDLLSSEYGRILILDRTDFKDLSFGGIRSRLSRLPFDMDFWIVDYIQLFRYIKEASGMKDPANQYTDFFMSLSVGITGSPTSGFLLSQTNRDGYKLAMEKEGEYDLTALAEVNALERDSADVMFLYSDDTLKDSNEIMVNLPKCRFGQTISKPITTFINPELCLVGEEVQGFSSGEDISSAMLETLESPF